MRAERPFREFLRAAAPDGLPLPAWARAADLVMAALACSGMIVAVSGGFQAQVGGWRVTVTSPLRLILWAVVVAAVRSMMARRPTIYDHLAARAAAYAGSASVRAATVTVVGTRPAIWAAGYFAVVLFGYAANAIPFHEFDSELLNLPLRWDAGWYLQIAANGYEFLRTAGPDLQQNVVFFPAYPLLVRAAAFLFGNTMQAYVIAAQCVSLAAFWTALIYVHDLASMDLTAAQSSAALWLIASYPFALFFGAIYSESLYLAAAAGAIVHIRRALTGLGAGEHRRAAAWGVVAGLTRPNGFVLAVPLALLAWADSRAGLYARRSIVVALAPVAGLAMYSVFVWQLTGSPISWLTGHAAWDRHYEGLEALIVDRYNFIAHHGVLGYASQRPYDLLNALGVGFALSTVWPVARRFGLAYAAFIVLHIIPPLAAGGLMSAGRFTAVLFPAFLWLAAVVPERQHAGWIATFAALQALNATLFYTWRPLY